MTTILTDAYFSYTSTGDVLCHYNVMYVGQLVLNAGTGVWYIVVAVGENGEGILEVDDDGGE